MIFFLAILFFFAFLQAAGEALRSRVAVPFQPPARQYLPARRGGAGRLRSRIVGLLAGKNAPPAGSGELRIGTGKLQNGKLPSGTGEALSPEPWLRYRIKRFWSWLLSWRSSLLVFWDTAFNVIQGKNQLQTVVFQSSIIDLQTSLVFATRQVCQEIHLAVIESLRNGGQTIDHKIIRVNVSLLSDDEQSLFYIAWEPGSLPAPFPKASVAWIAVVSGEAKWYKKSKSNNYDRAELTNDRKTLARLDVKKALVGNFYQDRGPEDYNGFIVLPIPWGSRGEASHYRPAGLHISFRDPKLMDQLWDHLERSPTDQEQKDGWPSTEKVPNYCGWDGLLTNGHGGLWQSFFGEGGPAKQKVEAKEPIVTAVLQQSVNVLAELLRHFNQHVFEDYIKSNLGN